MHFHQARLEADATLADLIPPTLNAFLNAHAQFFQLVNRPDRTSRTC